MRANIFYLSITVFKLFCGITAFFMVGYWIYKFNENEDVSAIDYTSYELQKEIVYPELSVCFTMPFVYENLSWDKNYTISAEKYFWYLSGSISAPEEYKNIRFNAVTLDLLDYVEGILLVKRNEGFPKNLTCKGVKDCPQVTFKNSFNGFINGLIARCFGFVANLKVSGNVENMYIMFKPELTNMLSKIRSNSMEEVFAVYSYPGQLLRAPGTGTPIWNNPNDSLGVLSLKISANEILLRRNKNDYPCVAFEKDFDDMVLKKHHEAIGCTPPYQQSSKPVCSSRKQLIEATYEWNEIGSRYFPVPCEGMSSILFTADKVEYRSAPNSLQLIITYPKITKRVRQLKAIDLHALIGNIGGYIGLFLG